MNATQHSVELLREKFKSLGGAPLWLTQGTFGRLEAWLVHGQIRIIHRLIGDNGVDVYQPLAAATFEELLDVACKPAS